MLPEFCYGILPSTGEVIILKNGEKGYYRTDIETDSKESALKIVEKRNKLLEVTKAQAAAMQAGSMFGWDCPAANPESYDESGKVKR